MTSWGRGETASGGFVKHGGAGGAHLPLSLPVTPATPDVNSPTFPALCRVRGDVFKALVTRQLSCSQWGEIE